MAGGHHPSPPCLQFFVLLALLLELLHAAARRFDGGAFSRLGTQVLPRQFHRDGDQDLVAVLLRWLHFRFDADDRIFPIESLAVGGEPAELAREREALRVGVGEPAFEVDDLHGEWMGERVWGKSSTGEEDVHAAVHYLISSEMNCSFAYFATFARRQRWRQNAGAPEPLLPALCLLVDPSRDSGSTRRSASRGRAVPFTPRGAPASRSKQKWNN